MLTGIFGYNSWSDLSNLFQCIFEDSEIAQQLSLGKTKCRYMYCIAAFHTQAWELLNLFVGAKQWSYHFVMKTNQVLRPFSNTVEKYANKED